MRHVPTGIVVADARDRRVRIMSQYGKALSGLPPDRPAGMKASARLGANGGDRIREVLERARRDLDQL